MPTNNTLRTHRKHASLKQDDLAFLMGYKGSALISQWEKGKREPRPLSLILYHFLFDEPLVALFDKEKEELCKRINERITHLNGSQTKRSHEFRIAFLTQSLNRLSSQTLCPPTTQ